MRRRAVALGACADEASRTVIDCQNVLGEGALWDAAAGRLHWVDIESKELWTFDPLSGRVVTHRTPERLACLAPRRVGGFAAAFASGFAFYDPATEMREDIAAFEPDRAMTRLNDGRTDRQGRFVAGGFDEKNGAFISSVVRLDPDRRVTKLFDEVACANGICFSPDGRTMYFADSPAKKMWSFDYDPESGAVGSRRELSRFDGQPGLPDGSCVDEAGCIWNAQWSGGRVVRFTPDGRVDQIVPVPVPNATCVAFGGASLDTLYITTARYLMVPEQVAAAPHSGALFACMPSVKNVRRTQFLAFAIAGFMAAVGAVLMAARLNSGSPNYGVGLELQAIAAAVIGGASLAGGRGDIVATLFGALTITIVQNGLNLNAVATSTQNVVIGVIIVLAVGIDMWRDEIGRLRFFSRGRRSAIASTKERDQ